MVRIIARLNVGGPAVHVALLSAGLNDDRFRTTLVTGRLGPAEGDMSYLAREMGVEPVMISSLQREIRPLADLRALRDLIRLLRRVQPHVVHTHTAKAGFVGRLAARLTGVPVVVHTFHGHTFHGYFGAAKTRLFITLEQLAARASDAILTISERLRADLLAQRIAPPERIHVVPLGLPLTALAALDGQRGMLRAEQGFSTEHRLVGIIGRLVPIKHHELFFEAARGLLARLPEARFVVVGDGERRGELEALAARLGLGEAVRFLGWRSDLPVIYADLDAVVITSRNEGTPVSLIEAMAAGVPVVSTAVGGVPDLLRDGELGALVPPGDAGAVASALEAVLRAGPGERTAQAQAWAMDQYGADRLVADMRRLYLDLLAAKGFALADTGQPSARNR